MNCIKMTKSKLRTKAHQKLLSWLIWIYLMKMSISLLIIFQMTKSNMIIKKKLRLIQKLKMSKYAGIFLKNLITSVKVPLEMSLKSSVNNLVVFLMMLLVELKWHKYKRKKQKKKDWKLKRSLDVMQQYW